jgi:hypothetical protein
LFDGFEDYDYTTAQECVACKPHRYYNFLTDIKNNIDSTEQHTGKYSLMIPKYHPITFSAPVNNISSDDLGYALRLKVDSTYTQAGSIGLGLKAEYFNNQGCVGTPIYTIANQDPTFSWAPNSNPIPNLNINSFSVRFTGKLKLPGTSIDSYTFYGSAFNNVKISINGAWILSGDFGSPGTGVSNAISLQGGQFYEIVIEYKKFSGTVGNLIQYKQNIAGANFINLYNNYLYSPTNVFSTTNVLCARLDSANVRGNALTDSFSVTQGKKMLFSAWVKEGGNDCKCSSYVKSNVIISYPNIGQYEPPMYPIGSIIEGWQRYEFIFTVPTNASSFNVSFSNNTDGPTNTPVYFDDIRIHPFNANLKSFVYNSSNLRLMSELDENNYASFYEYDDDGTLTRVKKETQLGIKTITETRSAMQKAINP